MLLFKELVTLIFHLLTNSNLRREYENKKQRTVI